MKPTLFRSARLLLLSATVGVWLWRLGWRPFRTATRPFAWGDLLRGLGVWVALIAAVLCWALVCRTLLPDTFAAASETQITGPLALITIVPFAALFTVYYIRTRRLWPIIVAHAFQDLLSLGLLAVGAVGRRVV